jgi:NADH-quinone oxidoreductase subunit H
MVYKVIMALGVLGVVLQIVPALIYFERKICAWIQGRIGPNRVGPVGIFQPLADAVKFIFKEDFVPGKADRFFFIVAPILVFLPPALGFAVLPFGNQIGEVKLQIADLPVGILFLMSVLSLGVYGIAFAGWASNNKYSLLGGLRACAQMVSYELTLGLSILVVIMLAESVDPQVIIAKQTGSLFHWNIFGGGNWFALPVGLLGSLLFFISALAENNRLPFDMPECEAELIAGYHTEYSSMKFAMFFMGEYVAMILLSGLLTILYLGGWYFPGITDPADHSWMGGLLSIGVFMGKTMSIIFVYIWIRWTFPRFRYDQLMDLGWKRLIPLSLFNVGLCAVVGVLLGD